MATVARKSSTGSVAIPLHTPCYRITLIASVLAQTFNDHEIVVLDDGWGDPPEIEGCLVAERTGSTISDKPTRDTEHALQVSEPATRQTDGRRGVW
jgi:hypothetical protein